MKSYFNGITWEMCSEDWHQRNINSQTETILENVQCCAGSSTRNVELMVCWDFCSQECLRRNACNSTDIVIKNLRACACCSALNLELLVVLSGGPLPEKKHQMITLNPTVRTVGQEIEIRDHREETATALKRRVFQVHQTSSLSKPSMRSRQFTAVTCHLEKIPNK